MSRRPRAQSEQMTQAFAPAVGVKPSTPPPTALRSIESSPPPEYSANVKRALVHFVSGGLSAGLVRVSLQPLDTAKTRLQAARCSATRASLRKTLLAGQGFRGLYRGVIPGVIGIVPAAAVYMLFFQTLKTQLVPYFPKARSAAIALSAAIGDVAACLVRVPCEVAKQRLQVGVYHTVWQAISAGPKVLYRGLGAQLARDVPYAATEFVVYEHLRGRKELGRGDGFLVGGIAGATAALASNPLDVVKTRLMTGKGRETVGGMLMKVAREEGMRGFAKGLLPRVLAKTLQSALFFGVYEGVRGVIAKMVDVEVEEIEKWRTERREKK